MSLSGEELKANFARHAQKLKSDKTPPPRAAAPRQRVKGDPDALPEAPEVEKAVLCAILYNPEQGFATFERSARPGFFGSIAREWFMQMRAFYRDKGNLEPVLFLQHIIENPSTFAKIGGDIYYRGLLGEVHPVEIIPHYLDELRDKYVRRQIIKRSFALVGEARTEDLPKLLAEMSSNVEDLKYAAGGPNGMERFELSDLAGFDASHDPDCLVGRRWLVRGGSCLMAGTAGIGKSTLAMQIAIYWAAGEVVFGPKPVRPLKSMIIQAEDDRGDVSEQYTGVLAGIEATADLDFEKCRESIEKNLVIYRCAGHSGSDFLSMLDGLAQIDKPDVIWVNPLFSFAGCDLMNAKETGHFLREGLFPIGLKRKAAIVVIHHIGKPAKKENPDMADIDVQYLGFGTSEIQNAFRAVNVIVSAKKFAGVYEFTFSKRGSRAGAKTPEGKFTQRVYLEQSKTGLCWLQIPEPKEKAVGRQSKFSQEDILGIMDFEKPRSASTLQARLYKERDMSRRTFFNLWDELKESGQIKPKEGGWIIHNLDKNEQKTPF